MSGIESRQKSLLHRITLTAQTAASSTILPIGAVIRDIVVTNTTANAITGGLNFGTTVGGSDIVAALAVGASAKTFVADAALLLRYFSSTAVQQVFFNAVTAWNSASIKIDIYYYV